VQFCVATGNMALKSMVGELKGIKNGISKRGAESENFLYRSNSHLALEIESIQQGQWASLPHELLMDIIRRVEESERYWPARSAVVFCASVCKSWRSATKEIIKTLPQCGMITFPIS
jgi:tubby and related proteins